MKVIIPVWISLLLLFSCKEPSLPKQHGFPYINFPNHEYGMWEEENVPYSFEKPVYASMYRDTAGENWFNIFFTPFDATLHLSFKSFQNIQALDTLKSDTRKLVYKHVIKASEINEVEISDSNGRYGMLYELEGETATSCNFYLTDGNSRFFRGALYFNGYTTIDSVGPVVGFIKTDIRRMINSFRFR